jgi:CheY-like chemotaxis protein
MATRSTTERSEPTTLEMKSVLLVDDDKQLATALQWILADDSFLVDMAFDGAEALEKVLTHTYDAVVCDVMMPRLRGDEFYFQTTDVRPQLADRFIFITGYAADPPIKQFLAEHALEYLAKPFPVEALIDAVRRRLRCASLA